MKNKKDQELIEINKKYRREKINNFFVTLFVISVILLNVVTTILFLNSAEPETTLYFTANNTENQSWVGYLLMHFSHAGVFHLLINLFVFYVVMMSFYTNAYDWCWVKIVVVTLVAIPVTSAIMYLWLNNITEDVQRHLGFSVLIATYMGILFMESYSDRFWIIEAAVVSFFVGFLIDISHLGHIVGFLCGVFFAYINARIEFYLSEKIIVITCLFKKN